MSKVDLFWNTIPELIPCQCEKARFIVCRPWRFVISRNDQIFNFTIPQGFVTDGASIPILAQLIVSKSGDTYPGSLAHDALYATQGFTGIFNRAESDKLFLAGLLKAGVNGIKARTMFTFVRLFSYLFWKTRSDADKENEKQPWWTLFKVGHI